MNRVSIVIPTYNRPQMLKRLLETIKNQTFKDFEVIVVDDNSELQKQYKSVITYCYKEFDRFTYLRNEQNRGAPYSRNTGILNAKYELIALVDDDDEWMARKLEKQVKQIKNSNKNVAVFYTWTKVITDGVYHSYNLKPTVSGNALKEILESCFIPSPSVIIRKNALLEANLFDTRFPSCQDWDMWTRILSCGYECDYLPELLTIYHKHEGESIGNSRKAKLGYKMYYRKHFWKYIRIFVPLKKWNMIKKAIGGAFL